MIINITKSLSYRVLLAIIGIIVFLGLNACTPPRPENEAIRDGNLRISLIEYRTKEPARNVEVEVELFNEIRIRKDIRSDTNGVLLIPDIYNKSFPLTISIYDIRYNEKKETINLEDITNPIVLRYRETIISGGIMDISNQVIEECTISTNPSVGITVETNEDGKFELASDNFTEDTFYRIIAEHRDYESAEWTRIKPTLNSEMTLGWKLLKLKKNLEIILIDSLKLQETTPLDIEGDVFDD